MATLDIRKQHTVIDSIKFDDTIDVLCLSGKLENPIGNRALHIKKSGNETIALCNMKNIDDFIAACQKAKELWGDK